MEPYGSFGRVRVANWVLLIALVVTPLMSIAAGRTTGPRIVLNPIVRYGKDPLERAAYDYFYNGDYDKSIRAFEQLQRAHPDDPMALNHLTTALLFKELYRIGALDTELYADASFLDSRHFPVNSAVRARVRELNDAALELCARKLRDDPDNVELLYDQAVARATRSLATGLLDRSWLAALRSAVGARHDNERVLELNRNFADAKLMLGVHYYIVGSLNWTAKAAASLIGLSGSKQKGLAYLAQAANAGGETAIDARMTLALFLRREERYDEAIAIVDQLAPAYPRNFLVALERANLLAASGRGQEAMAAYRKLLANGKNYSDPRLEQAAYGLAEVLRGWHDYAGAAEAFGLVNTFPNVDPALQARSALAAGEMYDVLEKRSMALEKYKQVLALQQDTPPAAAARKYMKQPYHEMRSQTQISEPE